MKKTNLFILLSFIVFKGLTQNLIAPSEIASTTVWDYDTVFLNQNLNINNGVVLEITPGTVVMSRGMYHINVEGAIQAIGNITDSIYFTAADTIGLADSSLVSGGWHGLHYINTSANNDSSLFEYCVLQYGKACGDNDIEQKGGLLYLSHFDKIRISNSSIRHNHSLAYGGGLYMEYCSGILSYNNFYHNKTYNLGGAVYMGKFSNGIIAHNLFKYNASYSKITARGMVAIGGRGAAFAINVVDIEPDAPVAYNNKCFNNLGPSGIIYESTINSQIVNNIVCNNYGVPIYGGHSLDKSRIINNTVANNKLFSINHSAIITHSLTTYVANNIAWNNLNPNMFLQDTQSVSLGIRPDSVQYNLLMDNHYPANGNIHMQDPMFVNPSPGIGLDYDGELYDWSLQDVSPAVNAGKPLSMEIYNLPEYDVCNQTRVYGGRIDIGACENQNIIWDYVKNEVLNSNFSIYPNPVSYGNSVQVQVQLNNIEAKPETIDIYNLSGKLIKQLPLDNSLINNSNTTRQEYSLLIDTQDLEQGVYIVKIGQQTHKLVVS